MRRARTFANASAMGRLSIVNALKRVGDKPAYPVPSAVVLSRSLASDITQVVLLNPRQDTVLISCAATRSHGEQIVKLHCCGLIGEPLVPMENNCISSKGSAKQGGGKATPVTGAPAEASFPGGGYFIPGFLDSRKRAFLQPGRSMTLLFSLRGGCRQKARFHVNYPGGGRNRLAPGLPASRYAQGNDGQRGLNWV